MKYVPFILSVAAPSLVLCVFGSSAVCAAERLDAAAGTAELVNVAAERRFSVEADAKGVWWFKDGQTGKRFLSIGISNVNPVAFRPKEGSKYYNAPVAQFGGDVAAWSTATRKLLLDHGFNTLGCWSGPDIADGQGLYRTVVLYLTGYEDDRCLEPLRPDLEKKMRENLKDRISKFPDRKNVIGVFYDNEMPWFGRNGWDDLPTATMLERAFEMKKDDPARSGALAWLKTRHADAAAFAKAWGAEVKSWDEISVDVLSRCNTDAAKADRAAFVAMLADKYYAMAEKVVRSELPDMMTLGTRFAGNAPDGVIRACGRHTDVTSVNNYRYTPDADRDLFAKYWILGGKPIMLTEYSFRAKENLSGNPNTRGAGPVVATQQDRAKSYGSAVPDYLSMPVVVGAHWFEFADQSPQGRFDGEDSNYGIVSVDNKPYTELLTAMKQANATLESVHAAAKYTMPTELPKPKGVVYRPGQHPDRSSSLDLLAGPWMRDPGTWNAPDASMQVKFVEKAVELTYVAGTQYGCGFDVYALRGSQRKGIVEPAADYDGYEVIVVDATAPKGVLMQVTLLEAAAGAPGLTKYDVGAGDDGEAFISEPVIGTGERATYRIRVAMLRGETGWGNQAGGREINATAVRNVSIKLSGSPATGKVIVHGLRLEK